MKEEDKNINKLLMIEKAVNEMIPMREQIAELKEWEAGRQLMMKRLQASEKKFKTLVDNIPQKMYMKDRRSVYAFCNEKYAADLKMKAEDIAGKTDYELFPAELAEKYVSDDKRIMAAGQLENTEKEYAHEGQTFIVQTVKTPVKDERGETVGILGIFWDITEQKRKEEELRKRFAELEELVSNREAELEMVDRQLQREITHRRRVKQQLQEMDEMFWTCFENTGTASVMIEENLIIILANREFEKLSGYPREEVEWEKSLTEFLTPDVVENIRKFYLSGIANLDNVLSDYECQFVGRGGSMKELRITAAMVPGAQKAVVSLLDITAANRTVEALQNLQEKYQTLAKNINEAILLIREGLLKCGHAWAEKELGDSTEPFRGLLNVLEKIFVILNEKYLNKEMR
jgi:PAS domain S-box-containing protein